MRRKQFRSEDLVRGPKPKPCPECPKYSICRKPCDEIEKWISQDHVGLNLKYTVLQNMEDFMNGNSFVDMIFVNPINKTMVKPDIELSKLAWNFVESLNIPEKAMEFAEHYYHQGKTLANTARALKISSQAANDRHKKLKKEIKERMERIELWKKIQHKFRNVDMAQTKDIIIILFFGALLSRKQIEDQVDATYAYVNDVIRKFYRKILDK